MSDAILISPTETKPAMISSALATSIMISPALAQAQSVPTRSLGSPLWDLAGRVPSLDLNFAQNRSLVDATTGLNLITFSRTSDATFVDSNGLIQTASAGTPRFDHSPITGESLGLLVEEQRTNLLVRSEEFTLNPWTLFGTASRAADVTTAPNGTLTADSVTLPVNSGIFSSTAASANTTYTFSIWIRCDSTQSVRILINTNLSDPTTKTVTATTAWQRFDVTKTTSVGTTSWTAQVDAGGGNTFYLWGAQLEAGAFPTSYIPTGASAVTRAADVASISGSNFSSWFNAAGGTSYGEFRSALTSNSSALFSYNDTTSSNRISLLVNSSVFVPARNTGGAGTLFTPLSSNAPSSGLNKAASAFANLDFALVGNGGAVVAASDYNVPTITRLEIGSQLSAGYLNGHIRRLVYWRERLANNVLQSITQ